MQSKEGDSIPAQRDALTKYAKEKGYIVSGEYLDDGVSGTKYSQRDELQRMLSDVQAGKIDLIIFTRLDRFFRSVRHYTATQAILDKHNVGWLAVWEPVYDTTTPQGRLIVNQMMSIAQLGAILLSLDILHKYTCIFLSILLLDFIYTRVYNRDINKQRTAPQIAGSAASGRTVGTSQGRRIKKKGDTK